MITQIYAEEEKISITIIAYSNSYVKENIIKSCLDEIQNVLIQSQKFNIVEKAQRDILLFDEMDGTISKWDFKSALGIGKSIGLDYVVKIEVNNVNNTYTLDIDLINIENEGKEFLIRPQNHLTQIDKYENLLTILYEYGNIIVRSISEIKSRPMTNTFNTNTYNQSIENKQVYKEENFTNPTYRSDDIPPINLVDTFCFFWLLYIPYLVILGLLPPI